MFYELIWQIWSRNIPYPVPWWLQSYFRDWPGNDGGCSALGGWLATTTRRECSRVLRAAPRQHEAEYLPDIQTIPGPQAATAEQELLLSERRAALREAFTDLPPSASS
jgi:DNA-directed RNA polymerase specialized sigma24 family protein